MSQVVIRRAGTENPRLVLEQLGDDAINGGVGGWEVLDRPSRPAMTAWNGTPGVTWSLPLTLDRFDTGASVERDVETLISWGVVGKDAEPPALYVQAPVGRGRATSRWVIQDIEWGAQIRNTVGDRTRQDLTLTLLEYVPGQVLKGPAAKSRAKKGKDKSKDKQKGKGKK